MTVEVWDNVAMAKTRVSETSPSYAADSPSPQPRAFKVPVGARGRMVLPADVRETLGIKEGDWLTLVLEPDGVVKLMTAEVWTDRFIETLRRAAGHLPPGRSLVDELIAERRREAAKEEREVQAFLRRPRKKRR